MRNGFPSREEVMWLRKQYPKGTRIELISTDDPYTRLKPGDTAVVLGVDDAGQLMLRWQNGSGLSLIPGVDQFKVIGENKEEQQ